MTLRRMVSVALGVAVLSAAGGAGRMLLAKEAKQPPDLSGEWRLDPSRSDTPRARGGMGGAWGGMGRGGFGGRGGVGGGMGGGMGGGWGPGGTAGHGGGRDAGRRGGRGGEGGGPRPGRLPDVLMIQQAAGEIRLSDSTGAVLEVIATDDSKAAAGEDAASKQTAGSTATAESMDHSGDTPNEGSADSAAATGGGHGVIRADGMPSGGGGESATAERGRGSDEAAAERLSGKWKSGRLEVQRTGPQGSKVMQTYSLEDKGRSLVIHTQIESEGPRPPMDWKRVYRKVVSS